MSENLNIHDMRVRVVGLALKKYRGDITLSSKALGVSKRTIYRYIKENNIET